jgi:hypothetical protein
MRFHGKRKAPRSEQKAVDAGRALLLREAPAVVHAIECQNRGLQRQARTALALVGWTPDDFYAALLDDRSPGEGRHA